MLVLGDNGCFSDIGKSYIKADLLLAQSKLDEANALFAMIDHNSLHAYHHNIYDELASRLAEAVLH
ncbi:hypothetical protein [Lacimicrobium alkaliphilum]|uniref:Uncharacterized protein n=1 Tax=Lacimicrobium alkaliphilum TaxID=1526571 RepID=A0ABQ1RAQ2_9ALTE|nr:hypothetical protein [Lacimicrobium alkaliphilum]GGD61743.1 hypothetical protein GCM10011357_16300 [Lacimicrobium alkaliphilum]